MSDPKVHVTDHAVVRYLERYQGLDVGEIKDNSHPTPTSLVRAMGKA